MSRPRLSRRFFARPSPVVARALVGRVLVRDHPVDGRLAGRIVEAEAYQEDDPASHSYRGPTPRNGVMFGEAGHAYVYFTYGMHFCVNVVTGRLGEGSAVLIRALEPLEGIEAMAERRGISDPPLLCAGPARLCEALAIDRRLDGASLVDPEAPLWIERGRAIPEDRISVGPRIGIRRGLERPWRFWVTGDPHVSGAGRGTGSETAGARVRG